MMQRLAILCTGPRVALLGLLAAVYTVFFILHAEQPLSTALQIAVEQQKAGPKQPPQGSCAARLKRAAVSTRADDPLLSFDGRWNGYDPDDAAAILCAMDANKGEPAKGDASKAGPRPGLAKEVYLTRHFPYDMVFPLLYGPAIAGLYLFSLASLGLWVRWIEYFAIVPLAAAALDLAENLLVRSLVVAGLPPAPQTVRIASILTVIKIALFVASLVVTLALLLWSLVLQSVSRPA